VSQRTEKVQKLAREVLAEEIHSLKDPRIGFATIVAVRVSQDLRHARVFVSVLGSPEQQDETMKGLRSATPHLRAELGRQMRMKYLPELSFELDHGVEEAERVERLLRRIHDEREGES
jgi:ribosome-binding factor A